MTKRILAFLWCLGASFWLFLPFANTNSSLQIQSSNTTSGPNESQFVSESTNTSVESKTINNKSDCINVNTANASELDELPGVGPSIAGAILEYRQKHRGFKKLADLDNVKGIGPAKLKKLSGKVCF